MPKHSILGSGAVAVALLASPLAAQTVQVEAMQRDVQILGARTSEWLGRPLACADFDNDGFDDLVVGTDQTTIPVGERSHVYVFRGAANFLDRGVVDLSQVGTSADVVISGEAASEELATSMAVGDFNDDGFPDIALADSTMTATPTVGSPRAVAGIVYIIYGSASFFATPARDLGAAGWDVKILGANAGDDIGATSIFTGQVCQGLAMGDINADGVDDIAIGAHLADPGGRSAAGRVHVVYGEAALATGRVYDLATESDAIVHGGQAENELGTAITIGDINGDGRKDLILGQEYYSQTTFASEGAVLVFFGSPSFPASTDLASQTPSVRILGVATYDNVGGHVRTGDVNGDGIADLLALAPGWDAAGSTGVSIGAIYGFLGRSTWPALIDLASTAADFQVRGTSSSAAIVNSLAIGNFDGDSRMDFFATARDSSRGPDPTEGRTFVLAGRAGFPAVLDLAGGGVSTHVINGGATIRQLGDDATTGDLNGDGRDEIILSVPFVNSNTGTVAIFGTPLPAQSSASDAWLLLE